MTRALIIVDYQNDFVTGSLAVPGAADALPLICSLAQSGHYDVVAGTRDWHPHNHCSFEEQGGQWPSHCVEHTWGADYASGVESLVTPGWHFLKGYERAAEAYSGATATTPPGLALMTALNSVGRVDIVGLALDYCVLATALEFNSNGFETWVILGATRSVSADTGLAAIGRLLNEGVGIA